MASDCSGIGTSEKEGEMKLFIMGFGKLGREVHKVALERGHEIVGVGTSKDPCFKALTQADVCIDCTSREAFEKNLPELIASKKPLVIATTGIESFLPTLREREVGCLYCPNFSIGFACFSYIVRAAALMGDLFDVAGLEIHHSEKKDAPSGSAKKLQALFGKEIPFSSVRVGNSFGTHTLFFEGKDDVLTLTHQAKGREGFAKGAVLGAEWILKRDGFFTMEDFFHDAIGTSFGGFHSFGDSILSKESIY